MDELENDIIDTGEVDEEQIEPTTIDKLWIIKDTYAGELYEQSTETNLRRVSTDLHKAGDYYIATDDIKDALGTNNIDVVNRWIRNLSKIDKADTKAFASKCLFDTYALDQRNITRILLFAAVGEDVPEPEIDELTEKLEGEILSPYQQRLADMLIEDYELVIRKKSNEFPGSKEPVEIVEETEEVEVSQDDNI